MWPTVVLLLPELMAYYMMAHTSALLPKSINLRFTLMGQHRQQETLAQCRLLARSDQGMDPSNSMAFRKKSTRDHTLRPVTDVTIATAVVTTVATEQSNSAIIKAVVK